MRKSRLLLLCIVLILFIGGCVNPSIEIEPPEIIDTPLEEVQREVGEVRFLSLYPELDKVYEKIAAAYYEETGATVKIESVKEEDYFLNLREKLEGDIPPTIFQFTDTADYLDFADLTADMFYSECYGLLNDKSLAINYKGIHIFALPLSIKGYGIIYNTDIADRYFALNDAAIRSMWEIRGSSGFKNAIEDMTEKAERLGLEGVFSSVPVSSGMEQLFNIALYYELWDDNRLPELTTKGEIDTIKFSFAERFLNTLDIMLDNSVSGRGDLSALTDEHAALEFARGESMMLMGDNQLFEQLISAPDSVLTKDNLAMFPVFIGAPGEVSQGLTIGSDNYFAINNRASELDMLESQYFIDWLYTSDEGRRFVTDELKFIPPYLSFTQEDLPEERPLDRWVVIWASRGAITSIPQLSEFIPHASFMENLGKRLTEYAAGTTPREVIQEDTAQDWKTT